MTHENLEKKSTECFIGLGSNLHSQTGSSFQTLQSALASLEQHGITLLKVSSCYVSKPHGSQQQNDFHNAVAKLHCTSSPHALLETLQSIESTHGRKRQANLHWGPRTLDLDMLLWGNIHISTQTLTIPHPQIVYREFVLLPLFEIEPELILPDGKKLKSLAENCCQNGIIKLEPQLWP